MADEVEVPVNLYGSLPINITLRWSIWSFGYLDESRESPIAGFGISWVGSEEATEGLFLR